MPPPDRNPAVLDQSTETTPPRRSNKPHNPYPTNRTDHKNPENMDIDYDATHDQTPPNNNTKYHDTTNKTPTSPPHNPNLAPKTTRPGMPATSDSSTVEHGSYQKSTNTYTSPHIPINDGTYRPTVRWKPGNYNEIYANQPLWDKEIIERLVEIFGAYAVDLNIIKWDDSTQRTQSSLEQIQKSGNIKSFLSPRITHLESSEQFIFGLRISMGDSTPSRWINDRSTKRTMQYNSINISISNSKTSSGDIVTAGHILLKHPEYTHRTFYLMSLRRSLPENTPYFDIGIAYTTPHGEKTPHLIVKCGSNHTTAITETLSAHLDGKKTTALFLATSLLKTNDYRRSFRIV